MVPVNLKSLVGKLNETNRRTLEAAAGLCLSRSNYNVELEHWLIKLVETPNTDLAAIFRQYEIDHSRVMPALTQIIDRFKTGNARPPALSPNVVDLIREGWVIGSIEFGSPQVRSGHLLLALLSDERLSRVAYEASREFEKISTDDLRKRLLDITAKSDEAQGEIAAETQAAACIGGWTGRRRAGTHQDTRPRSIHGRPDGASQEG